MYKVGLIGTGMSGVRFIRAINYLNETKKIFQLVGVYDKKNEDHLNLNEFNIKVHHSFEEFAQSDDYDLIIVATNESSHYDILCKLKTYMKDIKKIVIEKPLTETLEQSKQVAELYDDDIIIVHYLERCSEVISDIKNYIIENSLTVRRMMFSWGKNRVYDGRPTTGVTSELVHPLDLCLYLADLFEAKVNVISGNYIRSDYSVSGKDILDSVDISILADDVMISGSSSFVWPNRRRELTLYLTDKSNELWMIFMYFDQQRWDIDGYTIYKFDSNGNRIEVKKHQTDNNCTPQTICMTKIVTFLECVASELSFGKSEQVQLPHIRQSLQIQKIITDIDSSSSLSAINQIFDCDKKNINKYDSRPILYIQSLKNQQYDEICDKGY